VDSIDVPRFDEDDDHSAARLKRRMLGFAITALPLGGLALWAGIPNRWLLGVFLTLASLGGGLALGAGVLLQRGHEDHGSFVYTLGTLLLQLAHVAFDVLVFVLIVRHSLS
jgi:hypothetical protein